MDNKDKFRVRITREWGEPPEPKPSQAMSVLLTIVLIVVPNLIILALSIWR